MAMGRLPSERFQAIGIPMKKLANSTPSSPTSTPAPETALTTIAPVESRHWSRGALSGAGKLISTAANDEMVRNMIGSRARSQVAATVFGGSIMGAVAARIATRSVPGALLVGGALLAKALYDQRKAKRLDLPKLPKPKR